MTLIEGRVNVRSTIEGSDGATHPESLTPGQQLDITDEGPVSRQEAGAPLERDVVAARHHRAGRCPARRCADYSQSLLEHEDRHRRGPFAEPAVGGVFVVGDVETEALVLQRFLGLHERSRSDEEIVLATEVSERYQLR